MERRRLGRTGHESSIAILGAAAFWRGDAEEAERGFGLALDAGVNHLDIAPQYGAAEDVIGPLVPAVRDELFVGCKTTRRNGDGVRAQLEASLTKLGCDRFDLYQLHAVTTIEVLDERADAAATIFRAKDEGLTRFVGITGHNVTAPSTFVEALHGYDFDTVMFPVYPRLWADAAYRDDAERLLALCAERDVGVMAIKAVARRPWGEDEERFATSWYAPQTDPAAVERGVRFALSTPGVTGFCTPGDAQILPLALDAANAYRPMSDDERAAAIAAMAGEQNIFPIPTR
jgi:aryl-alcohol dehydrogenase-like predicted oxidoreductase